MRLWNKVVGGSLRELIFGMEDGLVSTLGVITGIATATEDKKVVILSGLILILVESLSMAAGSYLSNKAERDQRKLEKLEDHHLPPVVGMLVMGITYIIGGAVPLVPYLFLPIGLALLLSIVLTLLTLFGVGYYKGKVTKTARVRSGLEMVVVSATAAILGYLIGYFGAILLQLPR